MAALTTVALGVAAAAGTATQVAGAVGAGKRSKEAQKAISNYKRQELVNYAALQAPSTKEEELKAAQIARTTATQMGQLGKLGSRGVGMAAQIAEREDLAFQEIGAKMAAKQDEYKRMAASGAMNVQAMREAREQQDLAGLGQSLEVARQERAGYISGAASGLGSMAQLGADIYGSNAGAVPAVNKVDINANSANPQQFMENAGFNYEDNIMDSINESMPNKYA